MSILLSKIKRFLNWKTPKYKTKAQGELLSDIYQELRAFRIPIIACIIVMLVGTLGYVVIDRFSLIDALYQVGTTVTTVGFGEIAKISTLGRLFTIVLVVAGFTIFSLLGLFIVQVIDKGVLIKAIKEYSMLSQISELKNHFIFFYQNNYTVQLASLFKEAKIPFVVTSQNENFLKEAQSNKYSYYLYANPHAKSTMDKLNIQNAKGIITLSKKLTDNITTVVLTRLYEKDLVRRKPLSVLASADSKDEVIKLKAVGADLVVSSTRLIAQRLTAFSLRPNMENILDKFLYKKDTPLDIEEVSISSHSWIALKKIRDTHLKDYTNVSIIGITNSRGDFEAMPKKDSIIGVNSKLLLIGSSKNIEKTKTVINKKLRPRALKAQTTNV